MTDKSIDQWAAEQCGVNMIYSMTDYPYWNYKGVNHKYEWTIQDPRCMERIKQALADDHQYISFVTVALVGGFRTAYHKTFDYTEADGKTIAEAEIACIKAIMEAQSDE